MGETQKVESIRLSFTSSLAVARCKSPELNESGLLLLQLKAKLGQSLAKLV